MTAATTTVDRVSSTKRRVRVVIAGVVLLLLVGAAGAGGAWWWFQPAVVEAPALPNIPDAEVRHGIESARQKVVEKPRSADAWGHLGMLLLTHLYHNDADFCFAQAANLAPADPHWFYGRAIIALKRDPDHAVDYLRKAAANCQSWPEARSAVQLQLAQALLARRELDEAERLFQDELRRAGRSERATYGLGLVAIARGNNRAATEYLTSIQQSSHVRKKATAQLATLAADRGDLAAVAKFEKQLDTFTTEDAPWPDPFVDELRDLRVGFKLWERRAEDLEQGKHFAEAAELYLAQIEEHPTSRAYIGAASNLIQLRNYSRALALFRKGLQSDPDNGQLHYKLALAQVTRWDRWEEELRRNPEAKRSKEWLTEAIEHARRATEIQPDDAKAYLLWGWALMRLEEPGAAVEPLRRGVACRPEDFELQLALGEALLDAGESGEAETHLKNACLLRPDSARAAQGLEKLRGKKN